ncbi:MAG TPA: gamma-glutamyltransferase [Gammaproteobacteria bacterium]|nr:gamma-glutamyltransferase [Gammaproteobacteria bacterium]
MNGRTFLTSGIGGSVGVLAPPGVSEASRPSIDAEDLTNRNTNRSTVACQNGMVCASQPLAAMAGIDILKSGGNCVDAAIGVNAMLGLMEPQMCGIGGDLFAIYWSESDRRLHGLNASGRSPYGFGLDTAADRGLAVIPAIDPLSWTVPGCVSGWEMLSERFGALGLARCLAPAIEYAEAGFPLSPVIAQDFIRSFPNPGLDAVYFPDGRAPRFGDVFRNPELARSYRLIADQGPAAFYEGEIGEAIIAKSAALGGCMTMRDLADHTANWIDPVSASYRGFDVWELPPNGQGITVLQMLNLLEHFDLGELEPNSAEHLHLLIEAKKLAYEDRARYYADPEFAEVPVDRLISKEYAAERVRLIDPRRAGRIVGPGDPTLDSDTVYLTVADRQGNMISLIQSIYGSFGSERCPDGTGFAMQNRGQAFSLDPGHANRLEPHKRPFHTIIPGFVTEDGRPRLAFGVMGGAFQPQGHCQVLMNMLDFGMSPQQAGDQPRVGHTGSSEPSSEASTGLGLVSFEDGIGESVKLALADLGHELSSASGAAGGYQAIWRSDDPRVYFGGSDPRKDGAALGY